MTRDLGKCQQLSSGPQAGFNQIGPTGPSEPDKVFPGHEDGAATAVRDGGLPGLDGDLAV